MHFAFFLQVSMTCLFFATNYPDEHCEHSVKRKLIEEYVRKKAPGQLHFSFQILCMSFIPALSMCACTLVDYSGTS